MRRAPAHRARNVLIAGAALLLVAATPAHDAAAPARWEVAFAIRIAAGNGGPVEVRLALPADSPAQQLGEVTVTARGLEVSVVRDGPEPNVLLRGKLKGARRVAVSYPVVRRHASASVPVVPALAAPPPDLWPYLGPSPTFQTRSILVRDFLEAHVGPSLDGADSAGLTRAIWRATREHLTYHAGGKTSTLDVLRSGQGKRIGIERAFTTFLRRAGIPARLVQGIDLNSATPRKRVFWTEVWSPDRWWPVSASSGWIGELPESYVALTRDGNRVLTTGGTVAATYVVQGREVRADDGGASGD